MKSLKMRALWCQFCLFCNFTTKKSGNSCIKWLVKISKKEFPHEYCNTKKLFSEEENLGGLEKIAQILSVLSAESY